MEETCNLVAIEDLKQKLNKTLIINNFDLRHPNVLDLSCKINMLLIPFFQDQLPRAKIIKFPIK